VKPLKEYFVVAERPPIHVKAGRPVSPTAKWKHIHEIGLTKAFEFTDMAIRDRFIIQCIAHETQSGKQDVSWSIEGLVISVLIKESAVGLTEPMVEFARVLDSLYRDVGYSLTNEIQHEYAF
jgi:hypothetical protein